MATELVHMGFHNFAAINRVTFVVSADSAVGRRLIRQFGNQGIVIDMTAGRSARIALLTDSDHLILASANPDVIGKSFAAGQGGASMQGTPAEKATGAAGDESVAPRGI